MSQYRQLWKNLYEGEETKEVLLDLLQVLIARDEDAIVSSKNIEAANKQLAAVGIRVELNELHCVNCHKVTQSLTNGLCDFCSPLVNCRGPIGHT